MTKISVLLYTLVLSFGALIATPAHALVEARLTYGLLGSKPDMGPLFTTAQASNVPAVAPTYGLGGDVIISPPLFSWGVGVRYENMGLDVSANNLQFKANYTRTALIVNYRFIDTLLFLGPIATYGISHSGSIKTTQNGSDQSDMSTDKFSSYSIGLEAGAKLIGFHLGAEVGIEDFRWKGVHDKLNAVADQDINMSGTYAKVLLGFGI